VPHPPFEDPDCFSPQKNIDQAYSGGEGCHCDPAADSGACVEDSTGRGVALVCSDDRWQAVEDGPCEPPPAASCTDDSCGSEQTCEEVVPGGFRACVGDLTEVSTCMNPSLDECCDTSECETGICALSVSYPTGPCGLGGADILNECLSDECQTDEDCGSGSVCIWQGVEGALRSCIPATCRSDADCAAAPFGECAYIAGECLEAPSGSDYREPQLACIYAGDYCISNSDCASDAPTLLMCVIEDGRAVCRSKE